MSRGRGMTAADKSREKSKLNFRNLLREALRDADAPGSRRAIEAAEEKRARRRERNLRNVQRQEFGRG